MFDDLQSDGLNDGRKRERPAHPDRPLSDREVPLGPPTVAIADAVHAWLDGEAPESSVRRAEWSRDVDFWKRMNEDLERRRRMQTSAHVHGVASPRSLDPCHHDVQLASPPPSPSCVADPTHPCLLVRSRLT